MFTLEIDGETIVTDENFSFVLEVENPLCNLTELIGPMALGVNIAVNEHTRPKFGHPERFEKYSATNDRKFPNAAIRDDGFRIISGTLIIKSADKQNYSGWLQSDLGALGTAQRDKKITEMPWKSAEWVNKTAYVPGVDEYATRQVINPIFWDGKGRRIIDPLNAEEKVTYLTERFRELKNFEVNKILLPDFSTDDTGEGCVVSPYLFLNWAVTDMLRMNGFYVDPDNNALADAENVSLLIYNNFNIFRQLFNTFPQELGYWDHELNDWVVTSVETVTDMTWYITEFSYADLLPKIPLKDFIISLQNFLNVVFDFRMDRTVAIVNRNTTIDKPAYDLDAYFSEDWIIEDQKDVTLKFIQEPDPTDELTNDYHDLSDRRSDFRDSVETFEDLKALEDPQHGELRLVRSEDKIYEYKWKEFTEEDQYYMEVGNYDILEWVFVSTGQQPYFYGTADEIEEIKTGCSSLRFENFLLKTRQHGNVASARSLWADFSFRLIEYYGLQQTFLYFDKMFPMRWRNWADWWMKRKTARNSGNIPVSELYYIMNHITDPYRTRSGNFIIKKLSVPFKGSVMGEVEMEVIKR